MSHNHLSNMLFEPVPQPDSLPLLGGLNFAVGFQKPPGAAIGSPNHVLNDHSYWCAMDPSACENGEPRLDKTGSCKSWHERKVGQRYKDAERLDIPLFISEFGTCFTDGPCQQEISQLAEIADDYLIGWSFWKFKTMKEVEADSFGHINYGIYDLDGTLQ